MTEAKFEEILLTRKKIRDIEDEITKIQGFIDTNSNIHHPIQVYFGNKGISGSFTAGSSDFALSIANMRINELRIVLSDLDKEYAKL